MTAIREALDSWDAEANAIETAIFESLAANTGASAARVSALREVVLRLRPIVGRDAPECEPTAHLFEGIVLSSDYGLSASRRDGAVLYCKKCGTTRQLAFPEPVR